MRHRSLHLLRSVKFLLLLWLGTAGIVAQARNVIYVANSDSHAISVFGFDLEFNSAGFRETSPSIDRIDSTKGYTRNNVQIISWKANRLKAYATVEDLEILVAYLKQGE